MDRHRFNADQDPNSHFDADPDPDQDCHQNNADPHADPIHVMHKLNNRCFFTFKP